MDLLAKLAGGNVTVEAMSLAFDAMPVALALLSVPGNDFLYSNRAFGQLFGYKHGRFKTVTDWVVSTYPFAEDRALAWERWDAAFPVAHDAEFVVEPMQIRVLCQDGTIKNVLHSGVVLPDIARALSTFVELPSPAAGNSAPSTERKSQETAAVFRMTSASAENGNTGFLSMAPWERFVGERHREREALRLSQELLDRTGELAGVGGWDVDLLTGVVTWTAETHRLHAVPRGFQPTLESGIDFYAPEARATITRVVQHAIATGEGWDIESPLIRADGERIWVRTRGSVEFSAGRPVRLIGAFQDITSRVTERNALKLANERLVLATSSGQIATWDWDIANGLVFWDDRMYRMYGLDPTARNCSYATWAARVHPEDLQKAEAAIASALKEGTPYEDEFRVIWPDGSVHTLRGRGQATHDEHGKATRIVGVNWDVTEQLRLSAAAADALKQSLQMKDEFLSHVSHELRSPLASIYSFAGILADGLAGEVTPSQAEYLDIILRNSRQLRSMIDDLLQVTQSGTGKLCLAIERVSVQEALHDAVNTLLSGAAAKRIALVTACQDDLPAALADATRLRQILIVLLDNAVKFTPADGVIDLRAVVAPLSTGHIQISVSDTGPGIDREAAKRVFEHLYQVDGSSREGRKGLGLGLYIARDLVRRQNGSIWVESEPGNGTVFRFTVPIYDVGAQNPWGPERRRQSLPSSPQEVNTEPALASR